MKFVHKQLEFPKGICILVCERAERVYVGQYAGVVLAVDNVLL
jgi:hypothetical protein